MITDFIFNGSTRKKVLVCFAYKKFKIELIAFVNKKADLRLYDKDYKRNLIKFLTLFLINRK